MASIVAKHDEIFRIAMQAYQKDTRNSKFLELASKELEALGRLLGQAGPSINLHAHQHNVAVSTDAVAALFQPLDAGTYSEMVAAKVLPPTEAQELPDIEVEAESIGTDDWGSVAGDGTIGSAGSDDQPGAQGKNRRINHPMR